MFSPQRRYVLLPQDREIMRVTGMSEEEYRWFCKECQKNFKLRPGEPVALGFLTTVLIQLAIGALFTAIGILLAPKPEEEQATQPEETTVDGQDIIRKDRFTPKSGFDSIQNVVDMGSIIPLIYCKREGKLGGLRVNTNLLWSQLLSVGGGQFFKGIFMVGESAPELELSQTALGNNTLAAYELVPSAEAGRISVYYSPDGGRITTDDYELGVVAENDPGAQSKDIYTVLAKTDFCQAVLPSNQTEFGIYSMIGNRFGFKLGEDWTPLSQWQSRNDSTRERQADNEQIANRTKQGVTWSTRAGFIAAPDGAGKAGLQSVAKDDELIYKIFSSDQPVVIRDSSGNSGGQPEAVVLNNDIMTSIASRQRTFDESINVGDLYRIGSAIGICVERSDFPFISDIEFDEDGRDVIAKFKILEPGKVHIWEKDVVETDTGTYESKNSEPKGLRDEGVEGVIASQYSQMFRLAVAAFSVERPAYVIEVGLRSNLQLRSSGITNFNSLISSIYDEGFRVPNGSYQSFVDARYCAGLEDGGDKPLNKAWRQTIKAGRYSAVDTRYSFFRILYRPINKQQFTALKDLYGVRSATGVNVYNYLRFIFDEDLRREFRFVPVSGWEVRSGEAAGDLYVLDPHVTGTFEVTGQGVTVQGNGEKVPRTQEQFQIKAFKNGNSNDVQLGMAMHDDPENLNYVDGWARLAEEFIYDEVSTTASGSPEHSISYVNVISENDSKPDYRKIACVGLNIRSSRELTALDQLSVYCMRGIIDSHLFPDILFDLLTNNRYGVGEIFNQKQIDKRSFDNAAQWTKDRKYFFDGAITEKVNIRTWGTDRARDFLLDLGVSGGRFVLKPALQLEGPEPISALFTSGNIIDGTFQMSYLDPQERQEPIVSVRWRQERLKRGITERGLFPQIREITVRRKGTDENAPVVSIDLSGFATSQRHAIDRAKYECVQKRYVSHAISFETLPSEATLEVGSIIKLGMECLRYEQPRNGCIGPGGKVVSWPPMDDGRYDVILWDGTQIREQELQIVAGHAEPVSSVFCLADKETKAEAYKVQSVGFTEDGNVEVEAIYWPLDAQDRSLLARNFGDNEFTISGQIDE